MSLHEWKKTALISQWCNHFFPNWKSAAFLQDSKDTGGASYYPPETFCVEWWNVCGFYLVHISSLPTTANNIWEPAAEMSIESFQRPRTLIEVGLGVNPNPVLQFHPKHHHERWISKHCTLLLWGTGHQSHHESLWPWDFHRPVKAWL